jgi:hypothetical protein
MTTIKIKPSHPSQGDFVVIEESEFDSGNHELYEDGEQKRRGRQKKARAQDAEGAGE